MPRIPGALVDEMVAHAREELPNEACGMIHALDGAAAAVHRVKNAVASPYRYEMDPLQQLRLEQRRDETGETLFAIYHSHVGSEARPSQTDVRMAFWPPGETDGAVMYPQTYYVVVSLAREPPSVLAYLIRQGGVIEEEPVEIV